MSNVIGISFDNINDITVALKKGNATYLHTRALTDDGFEPHCRAASFQDSSQRFTFVRCTPKSWAARNMIPAVRVSLPGFQQALAEYQAWYRENHPHIPCELNPFQQWVHDILNCHPEDVPIDLSLAT